MLTHIDSRDIDIFTENNTVKIVNKITDDRAKVTYAWYIEKAGKRDVFNWSEKPYIDYTLEEEDVEFTIIAFVRFMLGADYDKRIADRVAKMYFSKSQNKVIVNKFQYEGRSEENSIALDFSDIEKYDFCVERAMYYTISYEGVPFDILINYRKDAENAVVCGTGANKVKRKELPFFGRSHWMDDFPCTGIWFFDPTLYVYNDLDYDELIELSLAYGYGTENRWFLQDIAFILFNILKRMNIKTEDAVFFGSSGGGTMSILLASMLHAKACAVNPQLVYENWGNYVKDILEDKMENIVKSRCSCAECFQREGWIPNTDIYVNCSETTDFNEHVIPFFLELQKSGMDYGGKINVLTYSVDGGHNAMPSKEDLISAVAKTRENNRNDSLPQRRKYKTLPLYEKINRGEYNPYINIEEETEELKKTDMRVSIELKNGTIYCSAYSSSVEDNIEYAYILWRNFTAVNEVEFSSNNTTSWKIEKGGTYYATVLYRTEEGVRRMVTNQIRI